MAVEVLLVREGNKLGAADPISLETIQAMKHGECLTASIRRQRNPKHHRLLFALLHAVFEHQTHFATIPDLLSALKLATGLFEIGKTVDGIPYCIPKSISWAAMCQSEFEQWYEKALDVILTKILPQVDRADLEQRVHDILEGRT